MQDNKRHKLFVDPVLQFKYVFMNMLFMLLFAFLIGGAIYFGIWRSVTQQFSEVQLNEDLGEIKRIKEYEAARTGSRIVEFPFLSDQAKLLSAHQKRVLGNILSSSNRKLIPLVLVMIVIIITISLFRSHRMAGPLLRFKRNLHEISDGNLKVKFNLRKNDDLREFSALMDNAVEGFTASLCAVGAGLAKIESAKNDDERNSSIAELKKVIEKYKYSDKHI